MRRTLPPLPLLSAALLTGALLAGCSSENTQGCPAVAREIARQVQALRTATAGGTVDAHATATALRQIQQDLDDIDTRSQSSAAATQAVADLALAVSDVKNELDRYQRPDIQPVVHAADELTTACPTKG